MVTTSIVYQSQLHPRNSLEVRKIRISFLSDCIGNWPSSRAKNTGRMALTEMPSTPAIYITPLCLKVDFTFLGISDVPNKSNNGNLQTHDRIKHWNNPLSNEGVSEDSGAHHLFTWVCSQFSSRIEASECAPNGTQASKAARHGPLWCLWIPDGIPKRAKH